MKLSNRQITKNDGLLRGSGFDYTFPKHSLTILKLKLQ